MDTSLPIEAKFALTYSERLRSAWALTLSSPLSLLWISLFPAFGVVLLVLGAPTGSSNPIIGWAALLGCFGFVPFMFFYNTYSAHRADLKRGPYTYRFYSDELQVLSATSELKQSWAAIPRIREQWGILLVYFNKRCAHCIPVRAMESPESASAVVQLASAAGVPRVGT